MMSAPPASIEEFCAAFLGDASRRRQGNLAFHLRYLFGNTDFTGRRVLDVGGGTGLLTLYAAARGAERAVCLDPGGAGSHGDIRSAFAAAASRTGLQKKAELVPLPLEKFSSRDHFDILMLHNSVNHLDERACIRLRENRGCRSAYLRQFSLLSSLAESGAALIVCDCSNRNFFADLHLPNPIDPGIEWHKHQPPRVWADLLAEVGFSHPEIRWNSFNSLRTPGRLVLGNRVAAYFFLSAFCLSMRKK